MSGLFGNSVEDLRLLSPATKFALSAHWWLWVAAVACMATLLAAFGRKPRAEYLLLALVAIFAASSIVLFACAVGYTAPLMSPVQIVE